MPQMNSDEASIDEPKTYTTENFEEDRVWHDNDNLSDLKHDLVGDLDGEERIQNGSQSKSNNHNHSDPNKEALDRDAREDNKGPGRQSYFPRPNDFSAIVSAGLNGHPLFPNGTLPPTSSKVSPYHPYNIPNPYLLYGANPPSEIDSKTGLPRSHPDIPSMYSLPGNLGQIPHPLAPWVPGPMYPMCTASTMASIMRYQHPFAAAFSVGSSGASVGANMPRFPLSAPHGMHPSMLSHAIGNGGMGGLGGANQHSKVDLDKHKHSKSEHHGHHPEKREKSDRPYVKKPLNAFMLYMKEQRAKVVAECTLKESAAINQILGRKWHSLSRDEQQKYYEMARKERQLHMQLYPGWSARDNYGKRKKRKKEKSQGECTDSAMVCEPTMHFSPHHGNHHYPFNHMAMAELYNHGNNDCMGHYYGNNNNNNNNSNAVAIGDDATSQWQENVDAFSTRNYQRSDDNLAFNVFFQERRKKKCIRYQHDDDSDSDYEDGGSLSPSPEDEFDHRRPNNPFDLTNNIQNHQQPIINAEEIHQNGLTNGSAKPAFPGTNRPSSRSPPQGMKVKEEIRTSPDNMLNGRANYDSYGSRPKKQKLQKNFDKNNSSPANGDILQSQHGSINNSNSATNYHPTSDKQHPISQPTQNNNVSNSGLSQRRYSDAKSQSSASHTMHMPKTTSAMPSDSGHSSLSSSSGSPGNKLNEKSRLSEQGISSRENQTYKNNSGPSTPRINSHSMNPSGANPFLPPSSGQSPLLSPNSMGFNPHSPHTTGVHHPFMPQFSPYLQMQLAANFMAPASPLGLPSFNGLSPMMGGLNSGSSSQSGASGGQPAPRHHGSAVEDDVDAGTTTLQQQK